MSLNAEDVNSATFEIDRIIINDDDEVKEEATAEVFIVTNPEAGLSIDDAGNISLALADFENFAQYNFEITATDTLLETIEQSVILRIEDIAEVAPTITIRKHSR